MKMISDVQKQLSTDTKSKVATRLLEESILLVYSTAQHQTSWVQIIPLFENDLLNFYIIILNVIIMKNIVLM